MYNVDTITLNMNSLSYTGREIEINGKIRKEIDNIKTNNLQNKIIKKMVLYEDDKKLRNREISYNKLSIENKELLNRLIKKKRKKMPIYWHSNYEGYFFTYNETFKNLTIMLPHTKIENFTSDEIQTKVKETILEYFELEEPELGTITLNRIDVKNDFRYYDSEELLIIKNILEKATNKYNRYEKQILLDDENGYILTYSSKKRTGIDIVDTAIKTNKEKVNSNDNDKNFTENFSNSNQRELMIYDKGAEMKIKFQNDKCSEEEMQKYNGIIRTEVRLKNDKLNSNKATKHIPKTLNAYYNYERTKAVYENFTQKILGKSPFYRIDVAKKMIEKADDIKKATKIKMCNLITLVNQYGYTNAKEIWENKHSQSSFRSIVKHIEDLEINILTFDKEIKGLVVETEKLNNFGRLEYGVPEYLT